MVDNLNAFLSHMIAGNFKIFSNHGGQFECIFSHTRVVIFKNFSQIWWIGISLDSQEIWTYESGRLVFAVRQG